MNKKRLLVIPIMFSICLFIMMAESSSTLISDSGIWKVINGDTIVQNDTKLNVNIGENASTTYKLDVHGIINTTGLHTISIQTTGNDMHIECDQNITLNPYGGTVSVINGQIDAWGVVPIGGKIDWYGDIYSLTIPVNFQMCDGLLITDIDSPIYGYFTPNLTDCVIKYNMQTSNQSGGNNSYTLNDDNIYHRHTINPWFAQTTLSYVVGLSSKQIMSSTVSQTYTGYIGSNHRTAFDNEQKYLTMIPLIRIK